LFCPLYLSQNKAEIKEEGAIIKQTVILFPLIGAVIGWVTNYLAVRMLFRPRKPIKILFFSIQGLLPKRRREVAENIARTVEQELLSAKDLSDVFHKVDFDEKVRERINKKIDEKLDYDLLKKIPLWESLILNILLPVKDVAVNEIIKVLQSYQKELVDSFQSKLDLRAIIFEKINELDMARLEEVVLSVASKELRAIESIGALLGFIIGLFQILLVI